MDDRESMEARLDRLMSEPVCERWPLTLIKAGLVGAVIVGVAGLLAGCSTTAVEYCPDGPDRACIKYRSINNDVSATFDRSPEGALSMSLNRGASDHLAAAVENTSRTTNAVIERLLATEVD